MNRSGKGEKRGREKMLTKTQERENDLAKGKRESSSRSEWGWAWTNLGCLNRETWLRAISRWLVVVYGGAMEVWWGECSRQKKKWKGRRDNRPEKKKWGQTNFWRETLCDGTSHMGGSHYLLNFTKMPLKLFTHYLLNFTKMPLKLNSQKLKTSKICFQFP